MNIFKGIMAAMLAGLVLVVLPACEKEGPAETAGEAIDEATTEAAEEAGATKEAIEKKMAE
jgi:hypothetical protein